VEYDAGSGVQTTLRVPGYSEEEPRKDVVRSLPCWMCILRRDEYNGMGRWERKRARCNRRRIELMQMFPYGSQLLPPWISTLSPLWRCSSQHLAGNIGCTPSLRPFDPAFPPEQLTRLPHLQVSPFNFFSHLIILPKSSSTFP